MWSEIFAAGYLGLLSLMWAGLVAGVPSWGARWRLLPPENDERTPLPRLSICVPARDEAANIAACVRAALASEWPDPSVIEVVVVDDRTDLF